MHRVLTALNRLFSSAVIFSTGCVKLTRTIMVRFGERENGYTIFAPAVGWNRELRVGIPNSRKSVLWQVRRIHRLPRLAPPRPDYAPDRLFKTTMITCLTLVQFVSFMCQYFILTLDLI